MAMRHIELTRPFEISNGLIRFQCGDPWPIPGTVCMVVMVAKPYDGPYGKSPGSRYGLIVRVEGMGENGWILARMLKRCPDAKETNAMPLYRLSSPANTGGPTSPSD